jgi:hypothetical protein
MSDDPVQLSRDLFTPTVGSVFGMRAPGCEAVPAVLTKITDRNGGLRTTQFSLLFRVPHGGPAEQNLYTLEHERIGSVQLLLVPVAAADDGVLFEAAIALLGGQPPEPGNPA